MDYLLEGKQTDRLLFGKLGQADFDAWLPFHMDPLSSSYWFGENSDPKIACQQWLNATFNRYDNNLGGMNALIEKKTGALIGQCGLLLQTVDGVLELEIGYSILPHYRNRGYATEAAKKCKEHAVQNQLGQSPVSIIQIANVGSQKVAKNVGMALDKTTLYKDNKVHIFRVLYYAQ